MSALGQLIPFLLLLVLLVLWSLAFWKRRRLALGILVGVLIAWPAVMYLRKIDLHEIPVWLPATPFAVIALALLIFGGLAWYWGRVE
jgi:hypothetical protein